MYVRMCVHVSMYACVYVCVYGYMHYDKCVCMCICVCTVNRDIFVLKNFHVIIFHVKIFSYTSRPYENILTTK